MIRQPTVPATDAHTDDRSMRWIEYALATVAILAAGILALAR